VNPKATPFPAPSALLGNPPPALYPFLIPIPLMSHDPVPVRSRRRAAGRPGFPQSQALAVPEHTVHTGTASGTIPHNATHSGTLHTACLSPATSMSASGCKLSLAVITNTSMHHDEQGGPAKPMVRVTVTGSVVLFCPVWGRLFFPTPFFFPGGGAFGNSMRPITLFPSNLKACHLQCAFYLMHC
jgi:hypothetical protein